MDQFELIQRLTESPGRLAWFLGAGASQSAGLPTAVDVIWYLKRRHYCSKENQKVASNDLQNPAIKAKIDSYITSLGFPATDDPTSYSRSFELIFGDDHERQRKFLQAILSEKNSSLTLGHRAFGALLTIGAIKAVFTTNFDSVVERAMAEVGGKALSAFHLEGSYAAKAALNDEEFPLYCKLHGDFRYESLKNLADDLKTQDKELGDCLVASSSRFGFVVAGYSGRDESVMELFARALDGPNPFPHGFFWTGLKGRPPLAPVGALLEKAKIRGLQQPTSKSRHSIRFCLGSGIKSKIRRQSWRRRSGAQELSPSQFRCRGTARASLCFALTHCRSRRYPEPVWY